ncbi:MAG: oxidoreductase [Melioribacteraceae bacterium]|nr:MAG: oxidoreductase [Melioribacteraceae bacterium]
MSEKFIPLNNFPHFGRDAMVKRSGEFLEFMKSRRTVREYSGNEVPLSVIKNAITAAALAPNGANLQPWHFVIVKNPDIKKLIREGAEKEEREFYNGKAPEEWINTLQPLGTDEHKPFLEKAPYLIVIFEERFRLDANGDKHKNYYTKESVGIATGFLITALHHAGLATLTHTPSPMDFLNKILKRPQNEKPYLILVTGYPAENCEVPAISKKEFDQIATIF